MPQRLLEFKLKSEFKIQEKSNLKRTDVKMPKFN